MQEILCTFCRERTRFLLPQSCEIDVAEATSTRLSTLDWTDAMTLDNYSAYSYGSCDGFPFKRAP